MLDDETLRDGLQSPSVRTPTIDEKIEILHHMNALGIDTADIGLPGAGPHVVRDVERLARAIGERRLEDSRELRRAHRRCRHPADRRHRAAHGRAHRMLRVHRVEPDSPVRRGLDDRLPPEAAPRRRSRFAVKEGLDVMYVTEDTTRADPASLARALDDRGPTPAPRACASPTPSATRPRRREGRRAVREDPSSPGSDWRQTSASTGTAIATAGSASPTSWRRGRPGATRLHGAALGIGERCGNTPIDLLLVNLVMMGFRDAICRRCRRTARQCTCVRRPNPGQLSGGRRRRVPHCDRRPRRRCGEGVPRRAIAG